MALHSEFGLMHITGHRDGPPSKVGVAITDLTTGLYASNSIMAALIQRGKNGNQGQHIDLALSDCQLASLTNIASSCLVTGQRDTGRWGTAHPSIVPYKSFRTRDGDICLGGGNDKLFRILSQRLGKEEWASDERFATNAARVKHRVELEKLVEAVTETKTTAEWLEILQDCGMPYAPINDVKDSLEHPHSQAREMVVEVDHPECGPVKLLNTPVKYSHAKPGIRTAPPTLGQHTDEILTEILGIDQSRISELKRDSIVA